MLSHSVIIPQRDAAEDVALQIETLQPILQQLGGDSEIIIVDDASSAAVFAQLAKLRNRYSNVRVLRCDSRAGASVAIAAGIAAAEGEIVFALDPCGSFPCQQLLAFKAQLARADAVFGKRSLSGLSKLGRRLVRIPRWLLLGLDVRDPGCRCWAARRECLVGLEPARGTLRCLAALVSMRGYRVSEIPVEYERGELTLADGWPNPGDLLAAWWRCRRYKIRHVRELANDGSSIIRFPAPQRRRNLPPQPSVSQHRKSA